MSRFLLTLSAIAITASTALAGPIEDRSALMKERGRSMGALAAVAKGQTPFDAAAVLATLNQLSVNAQQGLEIDVLWPQGSQGTSEASPKIWEDRNGFVAESESYKAAINAALATPPTDVAAVQAAMGAIGKGCASCHQVYRVKK